MLDYSISVYSLSPSLSPERLWYSIDSKPNEKQSSSSNKHSIIIFSDVDESSLL